MKKILLVSLTVLSLLGLSGITQAASSCQGKSKTACGTAKSCTWVEAHKRKNGAKVKAYCRSANKATGNKLKSKKKASSKSSSKASSKKTKPSKKKTSKKKTTK